MARETRKGKLTFAAPEEIEDEFGRLEQWLARVPVRDPFNAPGGHCADTRLPEARAKLEVFADQVQRPEQLSTAGDGLFDCSPCGTRSDPDSPSVAREN